MDLVTGKLVPLKNSYNLTPLQYHQKAFDQKNRIFVLLHQQAST